MNEQIKETNESITRLDTCGCYVIDSQYRLLMCHPTGLTTNTWSIPKGSPNEGEDLYMAAIRELREETGIRIDDYTYEMHELGSIKYIGHRGNKKRLHGFAFLLDSMVETRLVCDSYFRARRGYMLPEVDDFKWLDVPEAMDYIGSVQARLFDQFTF